MNNANNTWLFFPSTPVLKVVGNASKNSKKGVTFTIKT